MFSKWVNKNYTSLKSLNPNLPLAVRGVKGTPAVINVQYGMSLIKATYSLPRPL